MLLGICEFWKLGHKGCTFIVNLTKVTLGNKDYFGKLNTLGHEIQLSEICIF